MQTIYNAIFNAYQNNQKLLALLIDPEKFDIEDISSFLNKIPRQTTHIFVGGSTASQKQTEAVVLALKDKCSLPIVLFPVDENQITDKANGILFLSLLSGENPEYIVRQQIRAVKKLKNSSLEIIPTAYILIEGGKTSAVERVSQTKPLPQNEVEKIVHTALAGEFTGKKLIYLEAGSGALNRVSDQIIQTVSNEIKIPLIVGGGIRSEKELNRVYSAGATLAVIGTAFEEDNFLKD